MTNDEQALETLKSDIKTAIDKYNKVVALEKQLEYVELMKDVVISVEDELRKVNQPKTI
jgi:hypothetical protein